MQLNLGLQVEEEMKKQLALEGGKPQRCPDFCSASFSGCLCRNICHCGLSEITKENFDYLLADSSKHDLSDQMSELTEAEEQLSKMTRLQNASSDLAAENENLKRFLEYMETNYKNQYETQRLVIEDLKLQIEELLSQLKAAQNNLDIKSSENEELLKNLGRRKVEFEEIYMKLKMLEAELENHKSLQTDDGQSMDYMKQRNLRLAKQIANLREQLAEKDRTGREAAEAAKARLAEKTDEVLDLKNQVNRQDGLINSLNDAVSDLKEQLATKEAEIEALKARPMPKGDVPLAQVKAMEAEIEALRAELKKKNGEALKLRNENGALQEDVKRGNMDLENERLNHDGTREQLMAKDSLVNKHVNTIRDMELTLEDKDNRIKDLNDELEAALKGRRDALADLEKARAEIQGLNDELIRLRSEGGGRKVQNPLNTQLQFENDDLKRKLEALTPIMSKMQDENDDLMRQLAARDAELANLKNQLNNLSDRFREMSTARDNLKSQVDKSVLQSNLKSQGLQQALNDKDKQIADLTQQLAALRNDLRDANNKLNAAQEDARNARGDVAILRKQLADTEKNVDFLNKEKLQLNKNLKTLKDADDEKANRLMVLGKQLEDKTAESHLFKEQLAAMTGERDQFRLSANKMRDDLAEASESLQHLRNAYNKLQQDSETTKLKLTQERDSMSARIQELTQELERLRGDTSLRDQLEQLRKQYALLQAEMDRKNLNLAAAQVEISNQNQKIKELETFIQQLEAKVKQLTDDNDGLKKQLDELNNGLAKVLRETWQAKIITAEIYTELTDKDVDLKKQEKVITQATRDQYLPLTLNLLESIKNMEQENIGEVSELKTNIKNITREKANLLDLKQQLETKANDLQKRHDEKTRMVGQLAVKLFIFVSEVERLQGVK